MPALIAEDPTARRERPSNVRWWVCGLLFTATAINYIDRQVIGILKPTLQGEFGFDERDYAAIVFSFQAAYTIGLLLSGRLMDRIGVRRGLSIAVFLWSVGAILHAFAGHLAALRFPTFSIDPPGVVMLGGAAAGFAVARLVLGLGEAGNFPAAIKAIAEWFPGKERSLATGILNAGSNVGALITPLLVPWITLTFGWEWAFVATGALGFFWIAWWRASYRPPLEHPRVNAAELALIQGDLPEPAGRVSLSLLLPRRQTWAFALGKFLTDPIWWLYLFWVPDFLKRNHGLDLKTMGLPLVVVYLVADVGSIGGGWLSTHLIKRGWSVNAARKTAMLVCALAVVPMLFAAQAKNLWVAVGLVSLAAAAHQGWSANLFTMASDMFPKRAVGSVVGFGGMAGSIGGMLIALVVGAILQSTGSYESIFVMAASAYLVALAVIQILAPKLAPVRLSP
jgi:ACS family hexuronate transporter-like MFS transporter